MIANYNLQPADLRMNQPLVIGVARDLSGIYQGWRWQTYLYALSFVALASVAAGLLLMSQRRRATRAAAVAAREREREERALRQANELTERLQATEIGLRGTREHLALAADAARLGIWVRDVATNEVWVSDAWRALFGFDASEPVTVESFVQRVHPDDLDLIEAARTSIERLGRYRAEYRILLPGGELRWIASHGRFELDEQGRPKAFRAVSMETTEHKLAELELQQQRREVTHLARVVMLGELSGALAHELNQPLTAILSNAQAALRFMAQEPIDLNELREILVDIVSEDQRAGEVIKRLRQLLSTGETHRVPLDLNELLGDTFKLLRSDLMNQQVTLHTELQSALPQVWADRVQLQQVLINLMMNACDAMRGLVAAERQLQVLTRLALEGVQVSVVDQGCGLPGGQIERIFEAFYTTKPSGMGLGLSVCRTIIHAHGGRLWAENNPGAGASFHFTVPVSDTQRS
jgi:PAS domain S-box-containing protein